MVIIRFESDHKSVITDTLPNNQYPDLSQRIIFNSNETLTEMNENTHKKKEKPAQFHKENIACAREWSAEIKHSVWIYAMYLSNCCLDTQVLSIDHQHHADICHLLFLFLDVDFPLQRGQRHVFSLSPTTTV